MEEILGIVRAIDKKCDRENELSGGKIPAESMYEQILLELQMSAKSITHDLLREIKEVCYQLIEQYPPVFLNEHIENMLRQFHADGYVLNLASNTGFIESDCLVGVLKRMNIYSYFQFCVFSDAIKASKPFKEFFGRVFEQIVNEKEEVIHIGDNYQTDFLGAQNFGFQALLIPNEQYTYEDIKKRIHEKSRNL